MLFALDELSQIFKMPKMAVLHVGAHEGEESEIYECLGWGPITWVEAQPNLVTKLRRRLDSRNNRVIEAAVWDTSGVELKFNISSNSQSSSLLNLGTHAEDYPTISFVDVLQVFTSRLDEILSPDDAFNFINLDLQGVEGRALAGLGSFLSKVNFIYTEVNRKEVYIGCTLITELDTFLRDQGFLRVATRWIPFKGWGDALYVRVSEIKIDRMQNFRLAVIQAKYLVSSYSRATLSGIYHRLKN
jgi:FkbM family methyltransferase